jgi:hypothetical protein
MSAITEDAIVAYQRDGAVCLRGVFKDWIDVIAAGIERNMREPGRYAAESVRAGEPGSFFDDYCNWERIPEFRRIVLESPAAAIAAAVMRSTTAQFFHDHVLVKEPGTQKETPWHQDIPYYFVDGSQTVSFWIPVEPVRDASLRLIAGSQRWDKWVLPVRWLDQSSFYADPGDYRPVPDLTASLGSRCWNGRWSRAMPCCSTSAPCTALVATPARAGGGCFPCAGSATMRAMPSGQATPRRPTRGMGCRRGSGCVRTGSQWCGVVVCHSSREGPGYSTDGWLASRCDLRAGCPLNGRQGWVRRQYRDPSRATTLLAHTPTRLRSCHDGTGKPTLEEGPTRESGGCI